MSLQERYELFMKSVKKMLKPNSDGGYNIVKSLKNDGFNCRDLDYNRLDVDALNSKLSELGFDNLSASYFRKDRKEDDILYIGKKTARKEADVSSFFAQS